MSIKIMTEVWDEAPFKGSDLLVLLCLADFADEDGICYPAVDTIARKTRLSDRAVQLSIRYLASADWLTIEEGGKLHRPNTYQVLTARVKSFQGEKPAAQISPDPSGSDLSPESFSTGSDQRSGSGGWGENGARRIHREGHGDYDRFILRS